MDQVSGLVEIADQKLVEPPQALGDEFGAEGWLRLVILAAITATSHL
jgi:hypothetical protein